MPGYDRASRASEGPPSLRSNFPLFAGLRQAPAFHQDVGAYSIRNMEFTGVNFLFDRFQ